MLPKYEQTPEPYDFEPMERGAIAEIMLTYKNKQIDPTEARWGESLKHSNKNTRTKEARQRTR